MKKPMEEFISKNAVELKKLLADKREELRNFRFSTKGSKIRNTKLGVQLRKDIARILFVLGAKKDEGQE